MAAPSSRSKILPARGSYANLLASLADIFEGEIVYAKDEDVYYQKEGGVLVRTSITLDDVRLDAEDQTFTYTGDQLTAITGAELQVAITYNLDGSVNTLTKTSNGTSITKTFAYDVNGNLDTITVS